MSDPVVHERAPINDPEECKRIALRQADTINRQAERVRELIAERDTARADFDQARLVAAHYAELAGALPGDLEELLDYERRLLALRDRQASAYESAWREALAWRWEAQQWVNDGKTLTHEHGVRLITAWAAIADRVGVAMGKPGPRERAKITAVFTDPV